MTKNTKSENLKLHVLADKGVIAKEKAARRILEITVTAPTSAEQKERSPLNLSVVLDHSGSMQGEKLHFARQAAAHVIELLDEKDKASVVIYDSEVSLLFPSASLTQANKVKIRGLISNVHSGSSTFLSGGWLKGCEQVAQGAREGGINRTLLLTDGLANQGITDLEALAAHSRELFERGVSTSTFGVGSDYDEHLLDAMSSQGGGNFYFIEAPNSIPVIFEREFKELANITARDVEVTITLPAKVKAELLADWKSETKDDQMRISLGSLYSGREQPIYLRLDFPASLDDSAISIPVVVRGKGDGNALFEQKKVIAFKVVDQETEKAAKINEELMKRYAEVDLADQANKALKLERAGDRAGAHRVMNVSMDANRPYASPMYISKYAYMADKMQTGMTEDERKWRHQEEYSNKRRQAYILDYRIRLVRGHLVAQIHRDTALIDTGVPISIGSQAEWPFGNQVHRLSPEYMGVTLDYLSRMVGTKLNILLGTDILKQYSFLVDLPRERIEFHMTPFGMPGVHVPLDDFAGVPFVHCTIGKDAYQAYVDTGAKLSYVSKEIATGCTQVGKEHDFYPGMGEFDTPVYEVPITLEGEMFTLRCGVLPGMLETAMQVTGKSVIIGSELFQKYIVSLSIGEKSMVLGKIQVS
jgi:Ca-activated chloride channel family protein